MGEQKRYALVSGATGGMGRYICKSLLERGMTLYLPCRSREKEEELRHFLERESPLYKRDLVVCVQADFESFASVLALCERVMEECGQIELLMNNAAIIAPEFKLTPDGYERSLQVNYLVPRYMTELLLPHITRQVINTVSCSTKVVSFNRFCKDFLILIIGSQQFLDRILYKKFRFPEIIDNVFRCFLCRKILID